MIKEYMIVRKSLVGRNVFEFEMMMRFDIKGKVIGVR